MRPRWESWWSPMFGDVPGFPHFPCAGPTSSTPPCAWRGRCSGRSAGERGPDAKDRRRSRRSRFRPGGARKGLSEGRGCSAVDIFEHLSDAAAVRELVEPDVRRRSGISAFSLRATGLVVPGFFIRRGPVWGMPVHDGFARDGCGTQKRRALVRPVCHAAGVQAGGWPQDAYRQYGQQRRVRAGGRMAVRAGYSVPERDGAVPGASLSPALAPAAAAGRRRAAPGMCLEGPPSIMMQRPRPALPLSGCPSPQS